MTDEQKAAVAAAFKTRLTAWAAPLIQGASVFTRSAYQGFLDGHADELAQMAADSAADAEQQPSG